MKFKLLIGKFFSVVPFVVLLASCEEVPDVVEVVERRELCQYDDPKVYRSGYSSWVGDQPLHWRRVNGTRYRLLNYAVGEATEVAVGQVNGGGVLANLNRWRGEFGEGALQSLDGLERFEMLEGREAYAIRLKGSFKKKVAGMPVKAEGWGVNGVICDVGGGVMVTIKMMGPEEEVDVEYENLIEFAKNLRFNYLQEPSERSKKNGSMDKSDGGGY